MNNHFHASEKRSALLRRCFVIAMAMMALAAGREASAQVLLSDTFDRANNTNLGSFNNALGGTLASGTYVEVNAGDGSLVNNASINSNRLDILGSDGSQSAPGKVSPNVNLGTANFSITTRASSSLVNPPAGGTYSNAWMFQLRAPSGTSTYANLSGLTGQIDVMLAPSGQLFIRSFNSGASTTHYLGNPFTTGTSSTTWNVGTAGSLPTSLNGFAFDTDGDGNIDGSESFLFGARINGSTLNVLVNGSSMMSVNVPVAAPATNYAAISKQRLGSNTVAITSLYSDNLVVSSATTNSALAGTAVTDFRVMQNGNATTTLSLANTGTYATAFDLGLANASALAVTGSTVGTVAASGSTGITLGYASTATTGVRSGTVSIADLGTTTNMPGAVTVAGAVVANRTVSASAVDLGNVLVSATTATQTSTLTTTGSDTTFTRITVNGAAASSGGVTALAGTTTLFNGAASTTTRSVAASFGSSGAQTGTLNLSVTGEGLAGESAGSVGIAYTGTAFDPASLTKVQSGAVGSGGLVSLTNAAGSFRAAGSVASRSLAGDGGWSVAGLSPGAAIAAGASVGGTAAFDSVGKLNGTYTATFTLGLQNDQSIQGATTGDLGTLDWSLAQTVSGNVGSGSAALAAGRSLAGFSGQSNLALSTLATLLDGQTTGATTVTMGFAARPSGAFYSDVLELHGTNGLAQVLQLSFDPGILGLQAERDLLLGWKDGGGVWVNAALGNTGVNPGYTGSAFLGSWANYLAADNSRTVSNSLGAYGVDTENNVVWAAINHNSEFSVIIVPEPGALALAGLGIAAATVLRRRRS